MDDDLFDDDILEETSFQMQLYIYDMTKGLANSLSSLVLGKHIEGVWHTGVVVYGREYFFGSGGIESCRPGGTVLGDPDRIIKHGITEVPYSLFLEYIFTLGESAYKPGTYDLLGHNCNNFSNEVALFLTGTPIPEYILNLPQEVLNTPLGEALKPLVESLSLRAEGSRGVSFGVLAEEADRNFTENRELRRSPSSDLEIPVRKTAEKKKVKSQSQAGNENSVKANTSSEKSPKPKTEKPNKAKSKKMADTESAAEEVRSTLDHVAAGGADDEEIDGEVRQSKREKKNREPPIVFRDIDAVGSYNILINNVKDMLSEEERQTLLELNEFVIADTGAWALGAQHLQLIGRLLYEKGVSLDAKKALLKFLQAAALKDDIILLLHMDRRDHVLMNYVNEFESHDLDVQEDITTLLCNLCQPSTSSDWLMYISEWQQGKQMVSNSRVTTRVAVNSLLSDRPIMQHKGVTLMYNLALKEVFDDTATELASAILQYLHGDLSEEHGFLLLTALLRFMFISYNDVPALVKMMGPDIGKFKGKSERLDELVEQIQFKLSVVVSV